MNICPYLTNKRKLDSQLTLLPWSRADNTVVTFTLFNAEHYPLSAPVQWRFIVVRSLYCIALQFYEHPMFDVFIMKAY